MENPASPVVSALTDLKGAPLSWLQARPALPDMADLFDLNDDDFAVKCIREVLENRPFELPLTVQQMAAGDLFCHFYFESRNIEKVFGVKNLAVGYPMVLARMGELRLHAPLFLWQIQLEPHAANTDQWSVQRGESHHVLPNYPLFHLLDQQYGTQLFERARLLTEGKQMNSRALAEICDAVRAQLRIEEEGLPFSVQPLPVGHDADYATETGRLYWSAVVGIFPTLPKRTQTTPPAIIPDLPGDTDWQHSLSLLPLDPSQRAVLHAVQQSAINVVEGASGTGKTYLASAIIINALAHGKKCLVVSKSINSLRRAQKFIVEKNFGQVSFILRDLTGDHLMLTDMLRASAAAPSKPAEEAQVYQAFLQQAVREQKKLDEGWTKLHTPVFKGKTFAELSGDFMRANRIEGKDLLLSQLNPADFSYSEAEYDGIVKAIQAGEPLFARFPTLSHPLHKLNSQIFTSMTPDQGLTWTVQKVNHLLDQSTRLHHRFITVTNDYAESLADLYEQQYLQLALFSKRVREAMDDGTQRYGADFSKPLGTSEKIFGALSDHYKQMVAAKEHVGNLFEALRKTFNLNKRFDFDFPAQPDLRDLPKIAETTRSFDTALEQWQKRIPSIVREDVRRLNAKSAHHSLNFKENLLDLETALDEFLAEFNDSGLYQEAVKHEMLTTPKRQEFLEDLVNRLEETQFSLRDYNDFNLWQRYWLSLQPQEQKVVKALCKIKPRDWVAAFDSWYLHQYLQHHYAPAMLMDTDTQMGFSRAITEVKNRMPAQISYFWQQRKIAALKKLKSNHSSAYKIWFGKDNRTLSAGRDIAELIRDHTEAITETLPVLLVTPEVATDVIQLSHIQYDVVIVDEAHNISKQQCYSLFEQAKHLVVFGDSKQDMTPQAQDDFLEYCKTLGAPTHTLEYQHQDCPEEWVDFNQIAFGTPVKRLPMGRSAQSGTVVANVEGRYDEKSQTNEAEARQVIDWLNWVEQTPAKTYPVVGIACATVQQRDLIAGQLLRIRQRRAPGYEKIQQLQLNGLGVYQFAELQGQHVDILMLSFVHGIVDSGGSLTRHLHFWNTQEGLNQLHVALTRATQRLYIAHSIPAGLYSVLAADRNFLGTCILSHLVTFGDHLQNGEQTAAAEQLQKMKKLLNYPETQHVSSVFMQEFELAVSPFFEQGQIRHNQKVAGITVPLSIKTGDQVVIPLFDGVISNVGLPSYEWEEKVRQYFTRHRVQFLPVMSAQWWKAPRQEAQRFASQFILEKTEEE